MGSYIAIYRLMKLLQLHTLVVELFSSLPLWQCSSLWLHGNETRPFQVLFFHVFYYFFTMLCSVCGRDLSYYLSLYLVRMSFFSAIIVTFVVFLVATYLGPADMNQTVTHTVSHRLRRSHFKNKYWKYFLFSRREHVLLCLYCCITFLRHHSPGSFARPWC